MQGRGMVTGKMMWINFEEGSWYLRGRFDTCEKEACFLRGGGVIFLRRGCGTCES
jgi:hypothetical protein